MEKDSGTRYQANRAHEERSILWVLRKIVAAILVDLSGLFFMRVAIVSRS